MCFGIFTFATDLFFILNWFYFFILFSKLFVNSANGHSSVFNNVLELVLELELTQWLLKLRLEMWILIPVLQINSGYIIQDQFQQFLTQFT